MFAFVCMANIRDSRPISSSSFGYVQLGYIEKDVADGENIDISQMFLS